MESTIGYIGELTVYTKIKNKIVSKYVTHNEGKPELFNFIVNCLAGDWSSFGAPKYIGVYQRALGNDEAIDYQLTPASSIIKNLATSHDTEASVEYTFTLSGSNIMPEKTGNVLKLFNSSNLGRQNASAEFVFENGRELMGTNVAAGISYVIVWKMIIKNAPTSVGN